LFFFLGGEGVGVKARFDVLTAVLLKIQSVWDVMLCLWLV